jgi:hypothetical protein
LYFFVAVSLAHVQVWPDHLVQTGSVDVTPVPALRKREEGATTVMTTVLQISTEKGPEKPKDGMDAGMTRAID